MGNLKINLDEITRLGKQMKEECYKFKNSIKSVKSDIDILLVSWKDDDAAVYSQEITKLINEMNKEEQYLEQVANFFITNADGYRNLQNSARQQITGMVSSN